MSDLKCFETVRNDNDDDRNNLHPPYQLALTTYIRLVVYGAE